MTKQTSSTARTQKPCEFSKEEVLFAKRCNGIGSPLFIKQFKEAFPATSNKVSEDAIKHLYYNRNRYNSVGTLRHDCRGRSQNILLHSRYRENEIELLKQARTDLEFLTLYRNEIPTSERTNLKLMEMFNRKETILAEVTKKKIAGENKAFKARMVQAISAAKDTALLPHGKGESNGGQEQKPLSESLPDVETLLAQIKNQDLIAEAQRNDMVKHLDAIARNQAALTAKLDSLMQTQVSTLELFQSKMNPAKTSG